jgi:hypothetical protein
MRVLKEPKFWGGVVTGVVLFYLWQNHLRGRMGQ